MTKSPTRVPAASASHSGSYVHIHTTAPPELAPPPLQIDYAHARHVARSLFRASGRRRASSWPIHQTGRDGGKHGRRLEFEGQGLLEPREDGQPLAERHRMNQQEELVH